MLTPQMLDVVIAAAQTLTLGDLGLLADDDRPGSCGVVILPRPLVTRLPTGATALASVSRATRALCVAAGPAGGDPRDGARPRRTTARNLSEHHRGDRPTRLK